MMLQLGADIDALRGFMLNGLDAAWMAPALRERWRQQWPARFDALRARLVSSL
jgi:adenosine deaminase